MARFFSVRLDGVKTMGIELGELARRGIPQALHDALQGIAFDIRNTAMASLQKPKSGRIYKRRGGIQHRASAPWEPPATDTGDLLSHITVASTERVIDVGAEVLHGLFLEEGTKVGGRRRMFPRPFLVPALEIHEQRIDEEVVRHLGRIF